MINLLIPFSILHILGGPETAFNHVYTHTEEQKQHMTSHIFLTTDDYATSF